jgi:hypothetical protein
MRRSSDEGQTEPLAALVALAAVCAGLSLYAGVLPAAVDDRPRDPAPTVLERVHDDLTEAAVVAPRRLPETVDRRLGGGWRYNVSLRSDGTRYHAGPTPPPETSRASRRVSVAGDGGAVRPGRLVVEVWR